MNSLFRDRANRKRRREVVDTKVKKPRTEKLYKMADGRKVTKQEFLQIIGSRGGKSTAKSPNAVRSFENREIAIKAGKAKGYKFNRKKVSE